MCLLFAAETGIPDEKLLREAHSHNSDGAGVAWTGEDKGKPRIFWKKGLSIDEVVELLGMEHVKLPLQIHFRYASIGGKSKELTHPFPVSEKGELWLEGNAQTTLMHNGHWGGWKEALFLSSLSLGVKVPEEPKSDSRALAILGARHGLGILDVLPDGVGRVCVLDADQGIGLYGNGWIEEKKGGFYQSAPVTVRGYKTWKWDEKIEKMVDVDTLDEESWKNYRGCP